MTLPDDRASGAISPLRPQLDKEAYIALGSNLGQRETYLQDAVYQLGLIPDTEVVRVSDIYETEPIGYADQGSFLNMVAVVRTALSPSALHGGMKEIEDQLGRVRTILNGPRTVDLDLLLMDGVEIDTPVLTVPHPRMWERAFVLIPLSDVAGGQTGLAAAVAERLGVLDGKEGVILWSNFNWRSASERSAN
ncbi:2-amino-4-hydroxy-6-hydroxymethyldihydropteridine diphosphokinase [Paenibacillus hodogayensis]|uniref:2-amino-4-hydroxy-6-hydroxymethyldihydropteridine diphosphokinase n=1 Tax=Paenibacillus hodogayensis TaxID=279208 RepID=A0ABV5W630_9BACL